MSYILISEKVE